MYFVYILYCQYDNRLYTGFTKDLVSRLKSHAEGFVRSTRNRRPFKLIHYEAFSDMADAKRRELFLKGGNGKKELEILLKSFFLRNKWDK